MSLVTPLGVPTEPYWNYELVPVGSPVPESAVHNGIIVSGDFKFDHELSPETRGRASLEVERWHLAEEVDSAKRSLVRAVVQFVAAAGLVGLLVAVREYWNGVPLLVFLVIACAAFYVMFGFRGAPLIKGLFEFAKARRLLRDWDDAIGDHHDAMGKSTPAVTHYNDADSDSLRTPPTSRAPHVE